jgi:hypothetical protein
MTLLTATRRSSTASIGLPREGDLGRLELIGILGNGRREVTVFYSPLAM